MAITEEEMTPTEISLNTKKYGKRITLSNLWRTITELTQGNVLICKNMEVTTGKLYSLTPLGKTLRERLVNSPLFRKDE